MKKLISKEFLDFIKKFLLMTRITCVLLIMCASTLWATESKPQTAKTNISLRNATVIDIIGSIEEQTDYLFVYNKEEIDLNRKVNISVKDQPVASVLSLLFTDTDNIYAMEGSNIIIMKKTDDIQQQFVITGTIHDESGEALPGVNVTVKNTTIGVMSDIDGKYTIEVPDRTAVLQFSFIGYVAQEVTVGNNSVINISLIEDLQMLDEVVVIGYGLQKKSDITGSVASISSDKLTETVVQNTQEALQGKVAGVDVYSSGARPGAGSTVRIRGNRSFQATNDPLYVIDGIPSAGNINDINPYDIVSMEVLKDASATAIYGSRGANGVILVTTKRGEVGTAKITFNSQVGVQTPSKLVEYFDAAGFLEMSREALRAVGQYGDTPTLEQDLNTYYGSLQDPEVIANITNAYANGEYDPSLLKSFDWAHSLLGTGYYQNYQLGVSGGTEKTQAAFSLGYQNDIGIAESQDYTRYSSKLSVDQKVGNRFKAGASINFSYNFQNSGFNVIGSNLCPLDNPYKGDTEELETYVANDALLWNNHRNLDGNYIRENKTYRTMGSLYAEIELFGGLRYRMNAGVDLRASRSGSFTSAESTTSLYASAGYSGSLRTGFTLDNLLYYDKTFGDHSLGVTLLQSIESNQSESYGMNSHTFPSEHFTFYNIGMGEIWDSMSTGYSATQMASFMGRVNYGLMDKYLLTASVRYDGSSMLAEGHKWSAFPSFSLAWKMHEEEFLAGVNNLSELKLRGGYGVTGQSGISAYATQATVDMVYYSFNNVGTTGYTLESMPNPNLSWEKTAQWNIGVDWGVLRSRITGTIDVYDQKTSDLLMNRQLSPVTGYASVMQNIGKTRNTGVELSLSGTIIRRSNFSWSADANWAKNKEQIVELYGGKEDDTGNNWFIGYPITTYYGFKFDGIWQTADADIIARYNDAGDNTIKPGVIRVYDKPDENGEIDYRITDDDKVILGFGPPKWTGSFSTNLKYKNFDLNVNLYTRQGHMINSGMYRPSLFGRYNSMAVDYWTKDNPSNEWPQPNSSQESPHYISTKGYIDGSFTRLKTISLAYTVPKNFLNKLRVSYMKFSFTVNNVYCWTDFKGYDPETTRGADTPPARSFLFGWDVNF